MTEEGWRRVAIVLAVVLAVLVGFGAAVLILPRGGTNGSSATPTLIAGASQTPTLPAGQTTAPATEVPTNLSTPTPSPSPSPSPTPIPTFPTATIQFVGLKLDSPAAPGEASRSIAFGSNGPGDIIVTAKVDTPSSNASVCLKAGTQTPTCQHGSNTINFKGHASGVTGSWTVTALGVATSAPTIDLTITWPVKAPKLTLSGFHADGTGGAPPDDVNGFTVVLTARGNGNVGVDMTTGSGHNWQWDVLVQDNTAGTHAEPSLPTAPGVNMTSPLIKNHHYSITVHNSSGNLGGSEPFSGTFSWV